MPRPEMVLPCLNCAAIATSLVEIERCGAPLTWMLPRPSVSRSAALTSSSSAAASIITPRASFAAAITALPTRCVPREAKRAHAMRAGVGIGGVDIDVLDGHAERLGADLPRHRFHALAEIDRRQRHGELAARVGMHQRLARIAAEIHADGIVDRRDAASAMPGHVSASWCRRRRRSGSRRATARPAVGAGGGGAGGGGACGGSREAAGARS